MFAASISILVDEHTRSSDIANVIAEGYPIVGKEHRKSFTNNEN